MQHAGWESAVEELEVIIAPVVAISTVGSGGKGGNIVITQDG